MAKTAADILTSVRGHIDEPSASYWTDAELYGYIDDEQKALWRKILALRKDYFLSSTGFTFTLTAGTYAYAAGAGGVPTDIWRIVSIRTTLAGYQDLIWIPGEPTAQEFIDGLRTDCPISNPSRILYALRNQNTIWVSPLPQLAITAQVDYIQKPTAIAGASSTFLLPDEFLQYVQYMAAADALLKGPVGDNAAFIAKAETAWSNIMELLDTPRSDQGPDTVQGMFMDVDS